MFPVRVAQKNERQTKNSVTSTPNSIHCRLGNTYSRLISVSAIIRMVITAVMTCTAIVTNMTLIKLVTNRLSRFMGRDAVMLAALGVYMYENTAIVANMAKKAPKIKLPVRALPK